MAEDLYTALERGELTVEYQPILTVEGALVGTEALVRWDHPTRGRLSPAEFLEAAERYKLTPAIAERVLDVALGDLRPLAQRRHRPDHVGERLGLRPARRGPGRASSRPRCSRTTCRRPR